MKYTITSKITGNVVIVEYDQGGLTGVQYNMNPGEASTKPAVAWMQQNLPLEEKDVLNFRPDKFNVEVVVENITFDEFWQEYDNKIGKQAAEKQWHKLTMPERGKAIRNIKRYKTFCQQMVPPRRLKDPERYLSNKTFNDDFKIQY